MGSLKDQVSQYIKKFCSCLDKLTEAWNTAGQVNYDNIHPGELGNKANYFALKLGLTTLSDYLPYNTHEWWVNSTAQEAKERYPELPEKLQG